MPRQPSRWKAQHQGCQQAVNAVRDDLTQEIERLRLVIRDFVEYHDNGQAGMPGHPKTYSDEEAWHAEWDRRYAALKAEQPPVPRDTLVDEGVVPPSFSWPSD